MSNHTNLMARSAEPKLLLLETSGRAGRVALAHGSRLLAQRVLDEARRPVRDLAPTVAELCREQSWRIRDLDAVAIGLGPGSYTGLRVGIMSAKTLAYATGCVALGIETFAVIARQAPVEANEVDVLADAQQQNVYVQRWRRTADGWESGELRIRPAAEWFAELPPSVWISGPGWRWHEGRWSVVNPVVAEALRDPQAAGLLALAMERWQRGEADDPFVLEPLYLRPSNAEENWAKLGR